MQRWLYLHGFNSSAQSHKAQQLQHWQRQQPHIEVFTPSLDDDPALVQQALPKLCHNIDGIIGSSLGGFYALYCHAKWQIPAVLVNPALNPHELLKSRLGPQKHYYSDHTWALTADHLAHWQTMAAELAPDRRCLLLMQTGDEVIDAAFTVARLAGIRQIVEAGGNHSFVGFERYFSIIEQHFHQ
ncbi:YqiA/YcfP family alpha/beta fold hydrolase [Salinibius halmophilus]|uniref:YqiA/YcfP family alpha/beta fold hydrolase n=1 Tax=Salinibius halmophilus TaxID=1853216 RepID=UPI000E66841A|nr:YqiA/YcfP family alpha/beta fold hydrolase [Salinibius halmophilus]